MAETSPGDFSISGPSGFAEAAGSSDAFNLPAAPQRTSPLPSNSRAPTHVDIAVGCRIRELRRRAGLTQREVSLRVGVTGAQFHRYERGLARISTGRLMRIGEALGLPLEAFIERGGPGQSPANSADAGLQALLAAYLDIPGEAQRQALLTIARSMSRTNRTQSDDAS